MYRKRSSGCPLRDCSRVLLCNSVSELFLGFQLLFEGFSASRHFTAVFRVQGLGSLVFVLCSVSELECSVSELELRLRTLCYVAQDVQRASGPQPDRRWDASAQSSGCSRT